MTKLSYEKIDIFPTRVWVFNLELPEELMRRMVTEVYLMKRQQETPRGRSIRSGWNSNPILFSLPSFSDLRREAIRCFDQVLADMLTTRQQYSLSAWANILGRGAFNLPHVHSGALLSGTFYLCAPRGSGHLVLRDPRPGVALGHFKNGPINSSADCRIEPRERLLIIFPGWLEHFVDQQTIEEERVSIAINADPQTPTR